MKLLSMFLRYGDRDYAGAFANLAAMYRGIEGLEYDAVLIDTSLPEDVYVHLGSNAMLTGGDNSRREFSGWNGILGKYPGLTGGYDLVNIVTSAFLNEYNGFYPYIDARMLEFAACNTNLVLAHVDAYPEAVRLTGRRFQTWACSKFLLAAPERIDLLGSFVGSIEESELFSDDSASPFLVEAPLSSNYREYLVNWLTGEGLPHGKWHSVFEMSGVNLQRFRAKALSVVDEHLLSQRFRATGARIVDYTWLHSRKLDADPSRIPDELEQVQERNRFLFGNSIVEAGLDLKDHLLPTDITSILSPEDTGDNRVFRLTPVIRALLTGNAFLADLLDAGIELHVAAIHLNQNMPITGEQAAWLRENDDGLTQDAALPVTRGLHAAYLSRVDLREKLDIDTGPGRRELINWWMRTGRQDKLLADFMPQGVYADDADIEQDTPLPVTRGLVATCLARSDLSERIDLSASEGRRELVTWWMLFGRHEPSHANFMPDGIYTGACPGLEQDAPLTITRGLAAECQARSDLREQIDLDTAKGRRSLVAWWMQTGRFDPMLQGFIRECEYGEIAGVTQDAPLPITRGLLAEYHARSDLRERIDLDEAEGRCALIAWWMQTGRKQASMAAFMQPAWYAEPAAGIEQDAPLPITRGLLAEYHARSDLRERIDLDEAEGRCALIAWWMQTGRKQASMAAFMQPAWYAEPAAGIEQDAPLPITRGLLAEYHARSDLRERIDLDEAEGRCALIAWWMQTGRKQASMAAFMQPAWYAEPAAGIEQDAPLPITRGLLAEYHARSDLRERIDLDEAEGRCALIAWWMQTGRKQASMAAFMQPAWYAEPAAGIEQDAPLPITRGLLAEYHARSDLRERIDLDEAEGRCALIAWWMQTGRKQASMAAFMQPAWYAEPAAGIEQDAPLPITRGLLAEYHARSDLRERIDLGEREGRCALIAWWMQSGRHEPSLAEFVPAAAYAETAPDVQQDAPLPITRGLLAEYHARGDLREHMDIENRVGRTQLINWWIVSSEQEPELALYMTRDICAERADDVVQDAPLPITRGMVVEYLSRTDLQERMDITTGSGREALIAWWMLAGRHEDALDGCLDRDVYAEVAPGIEQDTPLPITRGLLALRLARSDLREHVDPDVSAGRQALVNWWMSSGRFEPEYAEFMPGDIYLEQAPGLLQDAHRPITRGLLALYRARNDLQGAFDLDTPQGRAALVRWADEFCDEFSAPETAGETVGARPADSRDMAYTGRSGSFLAGGANLIGFGRGELGIGEDVRMAAKSLATVDFDFCVPAIPLALGSGQNDMTVHNYETALPLYNLNLIFLPNYETVRLAAASGNRIFGGRYNIACWQWELPVFPAGMELSLDIVDEIWSSTEFTANAMRGATDKPVRVMPMAVTLPELPRGYTREEFGLPEKSFIFMFTMDGNSGLHRKNPAAVIDAFQRAFPAGGAGVHLLLKTMNTDWPDMHWQAILDKCRADGRISVISGLMTRRKMIGLQSVCDCFVSLHRAEGFGRNIAEAMLLEKPVIVSGYSGNMDFTNDDTAYIVGGQTVAVGAGEYSFADGQSWWDADIDDAAEKMKQCLESRDERSRRAACGRALIMEKYSSEAAGARYHARLASLQEAAA